MTNTAPKRKQPARKTTKASPAKKRAPAKKKPAANAGSVQSMLSVAMRGGERAAMRAAILLITIASHTIVSASLVWFTLYSHGENNDRIVRLARTIVNADQGAKSRLATLESKVRILGETTSDRWTRQDMVQFCVEFQAANPKILCPDPNVITGHTGIRVPEKTETPAG